MLSLFDKDESLWVAPESLGGRFLHLLELTEIGRTTYFFPPVKLSREKILLIDNTLWAAMADAGDSLVTRYSSLSLDGGVTDPDLEHVLRNRELEDTIHDLRFKFKDGRRSVYLILSRKKVQLKIFGAPGDEAWKRKTKKQIEKILRRSPTRFFKYLVSLVPVMFLACVGIFAAEYWDASFTTQIAVILLAQILTWGSLPLFYMLQKGVYFTHAEITLAPSGGATKGRRWDLILSLLGPLIEIMKFILKLFCTLRPPLRLFPAVMQNENGRSIG